MTYKGGRITPAMMDELILYLEQLSSANVVKSVKKTIGHIGRYDCNYKFVTAANTTEQVIKLTGIVPALGKMLSVFIHVNEQFLGATSLVAKIGTTSSGNELVDNTTVYATDAMVPDANTVLTFPAPIASATDIYISVTPGANWSNVTSGKMTIYITYIDISNV